MNNPTVFYVVRHGESVGNTADRYDGHTDTPLTENGRAQALARGESLKHINFDLAFSSDLSRARETTELVSLQRQLAVQAKEILRERYQGQFEGKNREQLQQTFAKAFEVHDALSHSQQIRDDYGGVTETIQTAGQRLATFLREAALAYPGKTILVGSHGSIMRGFMSSLDEKYASFRFQNTGYFVIKSDGSDFKLVSTEGLSKMKTVGSK